MGGCLIVSTMIGLSGWNMEPATWNMELGTARFRLQLNPPLRIQRQLRQRPHADASGPLWLVRLGVVGPGGAGNVHVDPRQIAGEFLDEKGAGDGARRPAAGVGEVGDFALEELLVVVEHRQRPGAVAGAVAG